MYVVKLQENEKTALKFKRSQIVKAPNLLLTLAVCSVALFCGIANTLFPFTFHKFHQLFTLASVIKELRLFINSIRNQNKVSKSRIISFFQRNFVIQEIGN